MESEVMKAPKEVIDALDNWQEITDTHFIYSLFDDIDYDDSNQFGLKVVRKWLYPAENQNIWLEREQAVIEHVFGDTRLEVEDDK